MSNHPTAMVELSNNRANPGIDIGQANMLGVDGMDKPQASQMPPELLQKIREALAVGLARSFITKALGEMQSVDDRKAEAQ